jgi:hypothetical protein
MPALDSTFSHKGNINEPEKGLVRIAYQVRVAMGGYTERLVGKGPTVAGTFQGYHGKQTLHGELLCDRLIH